MMGCMATTTVEDLGCEGLGRNRPRRRVVEAGGWRWVFEPARRRLARVPRDVPLEAALLSAAWEEYDRAELRDDGLELVVRFDRQGRRRFRALLG